MEDVELYSGPELNAQLNQMQGTPLSTRLAEGTEHHNDCASLARLGEDGYNLEDIEKYLRSPLGHILLNIEPTVGEIVFQVINDMSRVWNITSIVIDKDRNFSAWVDGEEISRELLPVEDVDVARRERDPPLQKRHDDLTRKRI
jgi:hypothetical protein